MMKTLPSLALVALSLPSSLPSLALAQGTRPKPRPKTPKATITDSTRSAINDTTRPVVLGTRQLPGDFGRLRTTYTLGKAEPLNVTLTAAEYTLDHGIYESAFEGTKPGLAHCQDKTLLLKLTLQNPTPQTLSLNPGGLKLTALTPDGTGSERAVLVDPRTRKQCLGLPLKPGQKLDVLAFVTVPAKEPIQKLILQREDNTAVVRYDLTDKVAGLPWWAGAGAESKDTIAGIRDCVLPTAWFSVGLRGLEWTTAKLDDDEPGEGNRFLVAHLSFEALAKQGLNFGTFDITLTTEDGQKIAKETPGGIGGFLLETRPVSFSGELEKGERQSIRVYFRVARDAAPKSLTIFDRLTERSLVFSIPPTDLGWFQIRDCVRHIKNLPPK